MCMETLLRGQPLTKLIGWTFQPDGVTIDADIYLANRLSEPTNPHQTLRNTLNHLRPTLSPRPTEKKTTRPSLEPTSTTTSQTNCATTA